MKYPNITVQLTGNDGNAFAILGSVTKALRRNDVPEEEIVDFYNQATAGDHDALLNTCTEWVNVL